VLLPARLVAGGELLNHLLDAQALGGEQHDEVVEHIGSLVDEAFIRAVAGLDAGFERLLAHLLGHAVHAVAEQAGGVGALRHLLVALVDEILQLGQEQQRAGLILLAPAGIGAGMAHRAMRRGLDEQRIIVAVYLDAHHIQEVAACLALGPQALAAAAVEAHTPALLRPGKGFFIHITQHEHLARSGILNNGGNQTAALLEVDCHMRKICGCAPSIAQFADIATLFSGWQANHTRVPKIWGTRIYD